MSSELRVEVIPAPGLVHLGMPCSLRLLEPKFPKHYRLSWDTHLFLTMKPHFSGTNAHLVILSTPEPLPLHSRIDLLAEVEGHSASSIHHIANTKATAPNLTARRKPPNPTPHIFVPISQPAINKLFSIVGSPNGRGGWLARRLSPHFVLTGTTYPFRSGVQHWISI